MRRRHPASIVHWSRATHRPLSFTTAEVFPAYRRALRQATFSEAFAIRADKTCITVADMAVVPWDNFAHAMVGACLLKARIVLAVVAGVPCVALARVGGGAVHTCPVVRARFLIAMIDPAAVFAGKSRLALARVGGVAVHTSAVVRAGFTRAVRVATIFAGVTRATLARVTALTVDAGAVVRARVFETEVRLRAVVHARTVLGNDVTTVATR